jgi:glutamate racemase
MIGVFDSGFGGLTVLKALLKRLPEYDYIYLGDSARAPYGNHSKETVTRFTREGVEFLFEKGTRLVILACNTASACALRQLQNEMIVQPGVKDRNILGVVVPIAEAVGENGAKRIAVIGTNATVGSGVYEEEIKKHLTDYELTQKACPLLVPLIEEGWAKKMETKRILKSYLRDVKARNPEVLVPACTHYPILHKEIEQIMGKKTQVLDASAIVAEKLADYLERHDEIASLLKSDGRREFYTTDCPEKFRNMGSMFLGQKIDKVELA